MGAFVVCTGFLGSDACVFGGAYDVQPCGVHLRERARRAHDVILQHLPLTLGHWPLQCHAPQSLAFALMDYAIIPAHNYASKDVGKRQLW